VRELAVRAADVAYTVRAVLAPFIPSGLVAVFSGVGIAAIQLDAMAVKGIRSQKSLILPAPAQWAEREATSVQLGGVKIPMTWLALGAERAWTSAGTARPLPREKAARS
jgi:aconitate hydratase